MSQLETDLAVLLGAVIGTMIRSGQTDDDVRAQVDSALEAIHVRPA